MIRLLGEDDAPAFRALRLRGLIEVPEAFGTSASEFEGRSEAAIAQQWREAAAEPGNFTVGAFRDGALVGVVALYRERQLKVRHKAHLVQMYVAPEARGLGLGRALVERLIAEARTVEGLEQIRLDVVPEMTAARGLYLALGFTAYGREPRALKLPGGYYDMEQMVLRL